TKAQTSGETLVDVNDPQYLRICNGVQSSERFREEIGSVQFVDSIPPFYNIKHIMIVNSPFTNFDMHLNSLQVGYHGYKWTIKYPVVIDNVLVSEQKRKTLDPQQYSDIRYFSPEESKLMFQFCGCPFGVYRLRP
ncbi:MAG: hypothetical protein EBZ77_13545, partial [Chitinophagia bacterium]|nr:hypothetical protein [Chitinophagia bacterium]